MSRQHDEIMGEAAKMRAVEGSSNWFLNELVDQEPRREKTNKRRFRCTIFMVGLAILVNILLNLDKVLECHTKITEYIRGTSSSVTTSVERPESGSSGESAPPVVPEAAKRGA